jgi:UDP-MurNAc hydroxylase
MRVTAVGHACWYFETAGGCFLTDPVLRDPFEEGTATACPAREITASALPQPDFIFLSHRHLDHFDHPTLRQLDKDLPIYCPPDELLLSGLKHLEFTDIRPLRALTPHRIGELTLTAIPSVSDALVEFGLLIQDPDGSVLNQVDVPLDSAAIAFLKEAGPIDVHLAMYASQDFGRFFGRPARTSEVYGRNLDAAIRVGAGTVVPAAAGFRFVDSLSWLNSTMFPVSRERFIADLEQLNPDKSTAVINPGDIFTLDAHAFSLERQAASFVRMVSDDMDLLAYDPTVPVPALVDNNSPEYPLEALHGYLEQLLELGLPRFITMALGVPGSLASAYAQTQSVYRVEVVFPDGPKLWSFEFTGGEFALVTDREQAAQPNILWRVAASALVDLCEGRRGCFAIRTESRRWSSVVETQRTAEGIQGQEIDLPDLLTDYIRATRVQMVGEEQAALNYYGLVT